MASSMAENFVSLINHRYDKDKDVINFLVLNNGS